MKKLISFILFLLWICIYANRINAQAFSKPTAHSTLYVNNLEVKNYNNGILWKKDKPSTEEPNFIFHNNASIPDSLHASLLYSGGIWMCARNSAGDMVNAAKYYTGIEAYDTIEYYPGPIDASGIQTPATCALWDRIFPCTKLEVDNFRNYFTLYGAPLSLSYIPLHILNWPAKGNPHLIASGMVLDHELAPFIDVNADGIYNPVYGDFPCIKGDQALYYIINDNETHHFFKGNKLGVEVYVMTYAYSTSGILSNTVFYDIGVVNRSTTNYTDYNFGLFLDADIGCYENDFIGCQPAKHLAIAYNAEAIDSSCQTRGFIDKVPIMGIKWLSTPNTMSGEYGGMSSFCQIIRSIGSVSFPSTDTQLEHVLNGRWLDGSPFTEGGEGYGGTIPTKFLYPGNPIDTSAWSEHHNQITGRNIRGYRNIVTTSGPYNLAAAERLNFSFAVFAQNLDSANKIKPDFTTTINPAADSIQAFFNTIHLYCNDGISGIQPIAQPTSKATVFPNPIVGDELTISIDKEGILGTYLASIRDISGNIIWTKEVEVQNASVTLHLSNTPLAKGYYIVSLQQGIQTIQAKCVK